MPRQKSIIPKEKRKVYSKKRQKPLKFKLPSIRTFDGLDIKLTTDDLDRVTELIKCGASVEYVAYSLGCSGGEFNVAVNNSERLKEAIKKGQALDDFEITSKFREMALSGNIAAGIWYSKNKMGWKDSHVQNKTGDITINVVTGIDRDDPQDPIDAEYTHISD